jgi:cell division protein FtsW (lipid II flippase)
VRPIARYVLRDGCKIVFFCLHVAVFSRLRLRFFCKAYGSFRQAIALDKVYSGLVAQGVGIWIGFQAFINMGVNLGALPTKGLTLPLMSYGGSAIMMNLIAIAVVLRIDAENKQMMRGGRA